MTSKSLGLKLGSMSRSLFKRGPLLKSFNGHFRLKLVHHRSDSAFTKKISWLKIKRIHSCVGAFLRCINEITIVIYDAINDKFTFITRATWVRQGTQNNGFLSLFLCLFNRTNAAAGVSMELLNFFLLYFIFTTINISAALVQPRPTPSWSEIEWKEKRKILKFAFYCILAIGRLDTWPTGPQSFNWST